MIDLTASPFSASKTAWVISDGTKGMEVQSIGLATRMGLDLSVIRLTPPSLLRSMPRLGTLPLMGLPSAVKPYAEKGWPDAIITTGKRMAGLSILLRRLSKGRSKTIHIQDPKLPPRLFDVMIVPSHDKCRGDNVLVTTGSLNALTPEKIKTAASDVPELITILPKPLIVFMIGGSNRYPTIGEAELYRLGICLCPCSCDRLERCFRPSRRSSELAPVHPKDDGAGVNHNAILLVGILMRTTTLPGILDHAAAVVVTSDSVNMTCEACLSGKPVYRYDFRDEQGRIGLFHRVMDEGGYTRPLEPITASTFPGEDGKYLDETGRIAGILTGRKS